MTMAHPRMLLLLFVLPCAQVLRAQTKPEFGKSYSIISETSVRRCASDGTVAANTTAIDCRANSIFRLVDTLAAGDAVIRFWKWPKGDTARILFNYDGGDSTRTAYYFLLPKAARNKLKEQTAKSPTNGQTPIDAPTAPPKVDPLLLDTARLPLAEDRSFIYSIGTNFDFIDNLRTEKTYHDLRVWVPNLAKEEHKGKWYAPIGFEFNFNRFRTFSSPDSTERIFRDVQSRQVIDGTDTVLVLSYITNTVEDKVTSRFDNLGLSLSPMYRFTGADRKDVVGCGILIGEWQRSVLTQTTTRSFNEVTTEDVPGSWDAPYDLNYDLLPAAQEVARTTTDNFYAGIGLRLLYRNNFGTLNMRIGGGYSYTLIAKGNNELLSTNEAPFYLLQAEVIESKISGVKIGTEIRGFFIDAPTDPLRAMPRFSLYIAKEFQLKKIGDLLSK